MELRPNNNVGKRGNRAVLNRKKIRRSRRKRNHAQTVTIMYSNIQGVKKKKDSLMHIMEELDCSICLLAETMTCRMKLEGYKCITSQKSIGQNVGIGVRNSIVNKKLVKLYEPN